MTLGEHHWAHPGYTPGTHTAASIRLSACASSRHYLCATTLLLLFVSPVSECFAVAVINR